ncbi:MAG: pyruvate kinase [Acidobacteriota bacterium]
MRHTKIIATVGPACSGEDALEALILAGVDVFRLNFSHGTHESHAGVFQAIRAASRRANRRVAVLQDLSGPKIRVGPAGSGGPLQLQEGGELRIGPGDLPAEPGRIFTPYLELLHSARPGARLLLADGKIELRVVRQADSELVTEVVHGGPLGGHKGINAPGVALPVSAVTEKDVADLRFGVELGVDLVALSFVQTADDVLRAREVMSECGRQIPVIAKIERPAAVENLPSILSVAQGVMVARGDLGVEMPLEQLPRMQKAIIRGARALGRPAILATQVLESMRVDPRPTRAEVSDAANAVDEGADAIMLAGETAVGAYPVQAVRTLAAIIEDAELMPPSERAILAFDPTRSRHSRALCEAAVTLATTGQADAIVAVTHAGKTARLLSALRPRAPIYAVTASERVAGALALYWGVSPILAEEKGAERLERLFLEQRLLPAGAVVVFVNVSTDLGRTDANFVNLQKIG